MQQSNCIFAINYDFVKYPAPPGTFGFVLLINGITSLFISPSPQTWSHITRAVAIFNINLRCFNNLQFDVHIHVFNAMFMYFLYSQRVVYK